MLNTFSVSKVTLTKWIIPGILVLLFGGSYLASRQFGLDSILLLLAALCVTSLVSVVAYRFPLLTVALTVALGQAIDRDLIELEMVGLPTVGGLLIRFFDPILLGILVALLARLLAHDRRLERFFYRDGLLWTLLFTWVTLQALRSIGLFGLVKSLGEFRTYYQYLLLVPYIYTSFRTEKAQWRLFSLLTVLAFGFIALMIFRGGVESNFHIGVRWFNASSNFALLTGFVAVLVGMRYKVFHLRNWQVNFIVIMFVVITLMNTHRSIWLATGVVVALFILWKIVSFYRSLQLVLVLLLATLLSGLVISLGTKGLSVGAYLQNRLLAFTDPQEDATAKWRTVLWQQALERVREQPLVGVGLGGNFQFTGPGGDTITTSPHNFYVTLAYHTGVTGFVLYVLFILQVLYFLIITLRRRLSKQSRTILLTTLVVVLAGHAMFVAYHHEFFTLMYIGLGLATLSNKRVENPKSSSEIAFNPFVNPVSD
jgi:O-antigen ligase